MFKFVSILSTVLLFTQVLTATVAPTTERSIIVHQAGPGGVGICGPKFVETKIFPVATCFCHVLFTGEVTVNVQERAETDCISFFGSEEAILELDNPCVPKFRKSDDTLKKKKIENKLNFIRQTCFPQEDFTVIVE